MSVTLVRALDSIKPDGIGEWQITQLKVGYFPMVC